MATAYDFSQIPGPSPDEITAHGGVGALTYGTGTEQPADYLASLDAAGLHHPLIWEHNTDSILGGYDYGVSECRAWETSHPPGLVYLACDLNDGALGGRSVLPFCSGWCSVTREAAVGLYGPDRAILDGIASGIPRLSRWWGVVNWLDGGEPDNAPGNIDRWRTIGAHLIQMIGSPIPGTDENLVLRDDWWTTGGAQPKVTAPMYDYFATSPWDPTQTQIWWFSVAGHRYVPASEWQVIKVKAAFDGRPEPKPFKGTAEMFNASRDTNSASAPGTAPQKFNIAATTATAA
jgi:hypothetical protein